MLLFNIFSFFIFFHLVYSDQICCGDLGCFNDNYPFNHLPLPSCTNVINPIFNLFTRSNRNTPQRITRGSIPSVFNGGRRTVFLVHGFNNDQSTSWLHSAKNALLSREDVNAIIVGWGGGSITINYPWATSNTRVVGSEIAKIAETLISQSGASLSRMWCVGHSLGAHTCGHAGKIQKFSRITGLDPAGPLHENYDIEVGLNKNRAHFVDIIHTAGQDGIIDFGTLKPLGHADFYPNNGGYQPGCLRRRRRRMPGCSHSRAHFYFTESVRGNCRFYAKQRCTDGFNIPDSCNDCNNCAVMGYDASSWQSGLFNLPTNNRSPFCRGF